ncbi:MAG: hypothetical protein AAF555_02280 [Verrucomicrobiota bacterium]
MRLSRCEHLDLSFLDARSKLIDLAAFLDRLDRASGPEDFRAQALRQALSILAEEQPGRAARILEAMSDPTSQLAATASGKAAAGAWSGESEP